MIQIKRNTAIWIRVLVVLAVIMLAGIYIWVFLLGGRSEKAFYAAVDGRSTYYSADEEVEKALEKYTMGCGQAAVIGSDRSQEEKIIALAFCGLSDQAENDRVLRLLEDYGFQATFFLSGIEVAENDDFVQAARDKGNDFGSMGLSGSYSMQEKNPAELLEDFVRGRKVLTLLTDLPIELLYCNHSFYTANVRQAAKAAGFYACVKPGRILDCESLESAGGGAPVL